MTTTYTFDELCVSDLHKDAYGYRPSQGWWRAWNNMADSEKQSEWDRLVEAVEAEFEYEARREQRAFDAWVGRINNIVVTQGVSRQDAIRWDMDAEDADDVEHYCFLQGFGYRHADEINRILSNTQ